MVRSVPSSSPRVVGRVERAIPHELRYEDGILDIPVDARAVEDGVGFPPLNACHVWAREDRAVP
eukprot:6587114-Alexandrium_andersonii.AAC.1